MATLVKVTHIHHCLSSTYGPICIDNGLKALKSVCKLFVKQDEPETPAESVEATTVPEKNSFGDFFGDSSKSTNTATPQVVVTQLRYEQIFD